ncbi:MAG TPA: hypothetical protein VGS01_06195 [Candidatus Limnocylindria bacterium]|nr:hypothetical protein [Candidatus Limnocylindria bacterium]
MRYAAVALAVLLVVSCGGSIPAMRLTRFATMSENHYAPFDRSLADVAAARRVYDAVNALPPAKDRFCPASFGLRYRLSFNEAARVSLSVVIEGDGCAEVMFSQSDRRATDDAFWELLADSVGAKKADIYFVLPDEMRR